MNIFNYIKIKNPENTLGWVANKTSEPVDIFESFIL
jgi:hypothetical protein